MKRTVIAIIVLLNLLILFPGTIPAEEIKGQKPMMIIGDTFQFVPGSWAKYYVHDKNRNEYYQMSIAILEKERRNWKNCSWLEIEVITENNPPVVTKFLAEETKEGPGELMEVIVQIKGYGPFTVPKSFYEGKDKEVGDFRTAHVLKHIDKTSMEFNNKKLPVLKVAINDSRGKEIDALISEEILPIGLVLIESSEIGMYLDNWGMNARSKIEGTPVNFYLWLMYQIFEGLSKEDKK